MQQIIVPLVVISLLLSPLVSFSYATGKYKNENITKLRAYFYFIFISLLPIIVFILLTLGMVGLEQISGKAVIADSYARSIIIIVGFGLLLLLNLSVIFIVYIRKLKRDR